MFLLTNFLVVCQMPMCFQLFHAHSCVGCNKLFPFIYLWVSKIIQSDLGMLSWDSREENTLAYYPGNAALTTTFCLFARVNSFVFILVPLENWPLVTLRPVSKWGGLTALIKIKEELEEFICAYVLQTCWKSQELLSSWKLREATTSSTRSSPIRSLNCLVRTAITWWHFTVKSIWETFP